jgi:hypothetical protein
MVWRSDVNFNQLAPATRGHAAPTLSLKWGDAKTDANTNANAG